MMIMRLLRLESYQESFELLGLGKPLVFFCLHRGSTELPVLGFLNSVNKHHIMTKEMALNWLQIFVNDTTTYING